MGLVNTPEPIVVARAAIVPTTPEEPSTSKAGKGKRKAMEDSVSASSKKAKVETEATTSTSVSRSSSVRGRGAASPSKTSRGGKGSPKMEIPKFSLDAAEDSSTESEIDIGKTNSKSRGGSKKSEEVEVLVEENLVEEAITEAPTRGRRGAASKKPVPTKTGTRQTRGKKTDVEPETGTAYTSQEPASTLEEEPTKQSKVDKSVSMEESSEEETEKPKKGKRGAKIAAKKY